MLHKIRRSVTLTAITSEVYPNYDTVLQAIDGTYWSYASGTWTCVAAHTSEVKTEMSFLTAFGHTGANARVEIKRGSGGVITTSMQKHEAGCYSTTNDRGFIACSAIRTWAVNDQFRVFYSTTLGGMDIIATENVCTLEFVG